MYWQLTNEVSKCDTIDEFKNVMCKKKLIRENEFFDESIQLKKSPSKFTNFSINLTNEIFNIGIRMFLYLKFNDYTEFIPQNSGEYSCSCTVRSIFQRLEKVISYEILSFDDISVNDIKSSLILYLKESSGTEKKVFISKVKKLQDFILYEEYIPNFLRFNYFVKEYLSGAEYLELWDIYKNKIISKEESDELKVIKKNLGEAGLYSSRGVYPIKEMAKVIRHSKNYIEENYKECLEVLKILVERRKKQTNSERSRYLYNYFKNSKKNSFKNELLNEYQKLSNEQPLYIFKKGKYYGVGAKIEVDRLLYMVDLLEGACISIVLLGTAMRVGELIELHRDYSILDATYPTLVRVVFKTANNDKGEEYSNPIPEICLKCLKILSDIAKLKDYKNEYNNILISSIYSTDARLCDANRVNSLIEKISMDAGIKESPRSHQFRHSMAYLVASSDDKYGLELASMLLTHKNTTMTIRYLSMFNIDIYNAAIELNKANTEKLIDKLAEKVLNNEKLFGQKAKYLNSNIIFVGKQAEKFSLSLKSNLRRLISEEKFAIVQATHCMCIHDLSRPEKMKCHLGYEFSDEIKGLPLTSKCKSVECSNAIFTESDVEKLKELYGHIIDDEIRERLERNTHFLKLGGFNTLDPFSRIIQEYDEYKRNKDTNNAKVK